VEEGIIPQAILPLIPAGASPINDTISVYRDEKRWVYFAGISPIGCHASGDVRAFRLFTSHLIVAGSCGQAEVVRAFGVSKSSVDRAVRRFREEGIDGFMKPSGRKRSGGRVLTAAKLASAQGLLDDGLVRSAVADEIGVPYDTLSKAIQDGRLSKGHVQGLSDRSSRSAVDAAAAQGMGTACTRTTERVLAAVGVCDGATVCFEQSRDVSHGGVLCALPALLENGLLDKVDHLLNRLSGYYDAIHVLILLGFMMLCRIKTVEALRREAPGEFGLLLGLDRIPEVRCLRRKMDRLAAGGAAERWASHLSGKWMQKADPEAVGTLYIDGHVRVYHGSQTALPRRYVSRQRLCLRGTTDYWVHDALGQPFFVIEKVVDHGLLEALRSDIVPRLLQDIPAQPSEQQLQENPHLCRFIMVFDREGYSPAFFHDMWKKHRIGCITYHKHPRKAWPEEHFKAETFTMPDGEHLTMQLAEMGSYVGSGTTAMWMREVRKLTASGHQVSLISTAFAIPHTALAARLFSRWCQENFFRYMMQHFALDLLGEYKTTPLPDTERIVNPEWRELNKTKNTLQGKLTRRNAKFGAITLHQESTPEPEKLNKLIRIKAELREEIDQLNMEITHTANKLKDTPHHLQWQQLPEKHKFQQLAPVRRKLLDTIRMIAYRAETAMIPMLIDKHTDSPQARTILQTLFQTPADIIPETENKRLRIRLHCGERPAIDRRIRQLAEQLNQTQTTYPGTELIMHFEMITIPP